MEKYNDISKEVVKQRSYDINTIEDGSKLNYLFNLCLINNLKFYPQTKEIGLDKDNNTGNYLLVSDYNGLILRVDSNGLILESHQNITEEQKHLINYLLKLENFSIIKKMADNYLFRSIFY